MAYIVREKLVLIFFVFQRSKNKFHKRFLN